MPRLTRAESQARTRAQLVESAAEVFARRGFHGASVEEVAEEAGYSKGAVYSNFASKDELFLAVLQERRKLQVEVLDRLTERPGSEGEGMLTRLSTMAWWDLKWCLLIFEFWLYALRNPDVGKRLAELNEQFRSELAPLLAPFAADGIDPGQLASAALAMYQGLALQRHLDPGSVDDDIEARILKTLRDAAQKPVARRSAGGSAE
jgi:AcrR family transcriptional regulator